MAMFLNIIDNLCSPNVEDTMNNSNTNRAQTGVGTQYGVAYKNDYNNKKDIDLFDNDNNNDTTNYDTKHATKRLRRQIGGAAVVGGLVGTLVAGPVFGIVTAGGAAALASTTKTHSTDYDTITDTVRSIGDTAATVGDKVQQWEKENNIKQKVYNTVQQWVNDNNNNNNNTHNVNNDTNGTTRSVATFQTTATTVGTTIKNWERTNNVSEKVAKGLHDAIDWVADNLSDGQQQQLQKQKQ